MKNAQIEISNWLNSDRNYNDGVYLYEKYGNNVQLKRLFLGRKERYAAKLAYELGKLAGYSLTDNVEKIKPACPEIPSGKENGPEENAETKETDTAKQSPPDGRNNSTEQSGENADRAGEFVDLAEEFAEKSEEFSKRSESAAEDSEDHANRAEEQADRAQEFAGELENAVETISAIAKGETVENPAYPSVINRIIAEYSRLYNERSMLKSQQNAVPDENTPENIAKRKKLIGQIDSLSVRMEILYQAKKAYLENDIVPAEEDLFPATTLVNQVPEDLPKDKLVQIRNNLRSQITRAKNMLEYQSQKKADKQNPMPQCPKRKELEQRINDKEKQLAEVEEKLKGEVNL